MSRTRPSLAAVLAASVLGAGCAERALVTRPATPPSTAAWVLVSLAGVLPALVFGVLLTLPAWRTRRGARLAVALLSIQTGALVVATFVLAAVATRSWQLVERPQQAAPEGALLRLSRVDGDTALFALLVLLVVVAGGLLTALTALATRFAAGDDPLERSVAAALLALELGGAAFATTRLLLGDRGWPYLAPALALPVLLLGLIACWPRRAGPRASSNPLVGGPPTDGLQLTHG